MSLSEARYLLQLSPHATLRQSACAGEESRWCIRLVPDGPEIWGFDMGLKRIRETQETRDVLVPA